MVKDNKYFQPYNVITLCKNLSFFLYWKWDFFSKIHIKDDLNLSYHKKKQTNKQKQTKNSIIMVFVHNKLKIFMVREKLQQYEGKKNNNKNSCIKKFSI